MAQEQENVETLKRRGRRRLVGALALVLAAVIVLPMVFDPEPRGTGSTVNVRIPGEDETPFAPKLPAKKSEEYVVLVGAFANPQAVLAQLDSAKIPAAPRRSGAISRACAPGRSRRARPRVPHEQLKSLGFEPGAVAQK